MSDVRIVRTVKSIVTIQQLLLIKINFAASWNVHRIQTQIDENT